MWKDSIRNIVVIFQPNILRIIGFYVRHSAYNSNWKKLLGFRNLQEKLENTISENLPVGSFQMLSLLVWPQRKHNFHWIWCQCRPTALNHLKENSRFIYIFWSNQYKNWHQFFFKSENVCVK